MTNIDIAFLNMAVGAIGLEVTRLLHPERFHQIVTGGLSLCCLTVGCLKLALQ